MADRRKSGPARAKQEARLAKGWTHPIGTAVRYRRDDGTILKTKTRSEAELLGSHTAVIWLEGVSGCVALQRVTPEHLIDDVKAPPGSPTAGPITIYESVGGYTLNAAAVGQGHFGNIGCATQRDAHPRHGGAIAQETARANAQLWAASPDLLALVEQALAGLDDPGSEGLWIDRWVQESRAAIARVRGER